MIDLIFVILRDYLLPRVKKIKNKIFFISIKLRRCNLSNIGDRVRNISSNAENNPSPNPNIYTATYV